MISVDNTGTVDILLRFNNDSSANYSWRYSANGAADTSVTGSTVILLTTAEASDQFSVVDVVNIAAKEKLVVGQSLSFGSAGAGSAPTKWENTGKWVNTSDQITRIDVTNDQSGDFAAGSQVVVLGHD